MLEGQEADAGAEEHKPEEEATADAYTSAGDLDTPAEPARRGDQWNRMTIFTNDKVQH